MTTRARPILIGIGVVTILSLPRVAAEADLGPWRFVVTAIGNREFREEYSFHSRRSCEEKRDTIKHGVARVLVEERGGGTMTGDLARRLCFGLCKAIPHAR